jgi:hypothetical protein
LFRFAAPTHLETNGLYDPKIQPDYIEVRAIRILALTLGGIDGTVENHFIKMYPNPMSDKVTIQLTQETTLPVRLILTDLGGRVISETLHYETLIEMHRGNMNSGAYILEITGKEEFKEILMVR